MDRVVSLPNNVSLDSTEKIVAILLSYNAADTLERFCEQIPFTLFSDVILFDDASSDETVKIARKLGLEVYTNSTNLGYGGNIKVAIKTVLSQGADIIIDIHPDGEYGVATIPDGILKIKNGADLVLGNRFRSRKGPLRSGMFVWKYVVIVILNSLHSMVLGTRKIDFHTGFRVYSRNLFESVKFEENSNSFVFSFELIAQCIHHNLKLEDVPVETFYKGKKRGATLKHIVIYSLRTFITLITFKLARFGLTSRIYKHRSKPASN